MKRILSFAISVFLILALLPCSAAAEQAAGQTAGEQPAEQPTEAVAGDRVVLTIADMNTRSGNRYNGEMGMWRYLAEQLGVEIQYDYISPQEYASRLASGDLPDIVATDKNLSTILEYGVALNVDPYLEEYCPNILKGDARLTYDVFKQLGNEGDGFYFFPVKIGYNGVGYDNETTARGYVVRWDYYKELGYPPINNEDDFLSVLLQMHKNHPFTEEGYPTYLYGTDNFSGYDSAFRAELSVDYWAPYKYQNNIFTNEVFDGYTDPAHSMWWASMEWENKLYRAGKADGSYDMDLFTQTIEQFDAKVARGQYLGLYRVQYGSDFRHQFLYERVSAAGQRPRLYVVHFSEQPAQGRGSESFQFNVRSRFCAGTYTWPPGRDLGLWRGRRSPDERVRTGAAGCV